MADLKISLEEIDHLMDKLAASNLGEITLEDGDFKLTISSKAQPNVPVQMFAPQQTQPAQLAQAVGSVEINMDSKAEAQKGNLMKSPIVGTFYASISPDKPPFVKVGSRVKKGDILFVIESMKLMNEIQSDYDGEIMEILVENAQGVEYNQPVMIIN